MKVIFLDVDGVMNDWHTKIKCDAPPHYLFVEDKYVERIRQITDATGAKVVLSSDWRYGWDKEDESNCSPEFIQLRNKLRDFGIELYDKTPLIGTGRWRGPEIASWLEHSNEKVESFVILDDREDMYPVQDYLIQTIPAISGITPEDVLDATGMLNREADSRKIA